jgi:transposase-like protein
LVDTSDKLLRGRGVLMTTRTRRGFREEFRREEVGLLEGSGCALMQAAKELGIRPSMRRNWRAAWSCGRSGHGLGAPRYGGIDGFSAAGSDLPVAEGVRAGADEARHLRKSHRHPLGPAAMRGRFPEDHRTVFPLRAMCLVLEVSASG